MTSIVSEFWLSAFYSFIPKPGIHPLNVSVLLYLAFRMQRLRLHFLGKISGESKYISGEKLHGKVSISSKNNRKIIAYFQFHIYLIDGDYEEKLLLSAEGSSQHWQWRGFCSSQ